MFADKVIQTLTESDKKILFYFDADGSKKEEWAAIDEAGIKVIEVTLNYFELKYKLEMEWNTQKVLPCWHKRLACAPKQESYPQLPEVFLVSCWAKSPTSDSSLINAVGQSPPLR